MKVSIVKKFNSVECDIDILQALKGIKHGMYSKQVRIVRDTFKTAGKDDADKCKKFLLPGITFSGTFDKIRKRENLLEYIPNVVLDYDDIPSEDISLIKEKIRECRYTFASFLSPKGNGVKVLVRTNGSLEHYDQAYSQVVGFYDQILGIECDYGGGYGYERLCFYSDDPELYYNPSSEIFKSI